VKEPVVTVAPWRYGAGRTGGNVDRVAALGDVATVTAPTLRSMRRPGRRVWRPPWASSDPTRTRLQTTARAGDGAPDRSTARFVGGLTRSDKGDSVNLGLYGVYP